MIGSSEWVFSIGRVKVTNTDPDGYAPNDADLRAVRKSMEAQIERGYGHLTFDVGRLHVAIELNEAAVLREAVKPLESHDLTRT